MVRGKLCAELLENYYPVVLALIYLQKAGQTKQKKDTSRKPSSSLFEKKVTSKIITNKKL